jgi:formamidopyrimidine-DNA glycosylase
LKKRDAKLGGRQNLAAFDFPNGSLTLTEAGSKRRASLHVISGRRSRFARRRGIDVFDADLNSFEAC